MISVKAGNTTVAHVRELRGVLEREQAALSVLITMQEPTQPMRAEAASAGFYETPYQERRVSRLQLLTIAELLEGKRIELAPARQDQTLRTAPKVKGKKLHTHKPLEFGEGEPDQ